MADVSSPSNPGLVSTNSHGPAVVEWVGPDGHAQHLGLDEPFRRAYFHIHFGADFKTLLFKLRILVALENSSDSPTPVFLFIHPELVKSCAHIQDDESTEKLKHIVKKPASGSTVHLRLELLKPADLVFPKTSTGASETALSLSAALPSVLVSLAGSTTLDIYTPLVNIRDPPAALISYICEAISCRALKTNTSSADLTSLYGGKGGQVLALSNIEASVPAYCEAPPSYGELAPSPPPALLVPEKAGSSGASRKRRRSGSPDDVLSEKPRPDVEDVFARLFEDALSGMENRIEARMQDWLDVRLRKQADEARRAEDRMKEYFEDRLKQQEDALLRALDEGQDKLKEQFQDQLEAVRDETDDLCDVRIDDTLQSVKIECEDFVKDEVREAKRGILQHFRRVAGILSDIDADLVNGY